MLFNTAPVDYSNFSHRPSSLIVFAVDPIRSSVSFTISKCHLIRDGFRKFFGNFTVHGYPPMDSVLFQHTSESTDQRR